MSNIYQTADVQRLITPQKERGERVSKLFKDTADETGEKATVQELTARLFENIVHLIEEVEWRC